MNVDGGVYDYPDVARPDCCGWRCGVDSVRQGAQFAAGGRLKLVAPSWCSTWSPAARRVMRTEAQQTVRVRCWVPDASVTNTMWVSLGTGRRVIAVGG